VGEGEDVGGRDNEVVTGDGVDKEIIEVDMTEDSNAGHTLVSASEIRLILLHTCHVFR
jgi:hypothetical protein